MKAKLVLIIVLLSLAVGCIQQPVSRPQDHFLPVGSKVILILDLSLLADELKEWPFHCVQETRGLVCKSAITY